MDDKIFESIMSSNRQFREINVNIIKDGADVAERISATAENFSKHVTSLVVSNFPKDDNGLAALLRSQPALRRINCCSIGKVAFEELCRTRDLEFLCAGFSQGVTGELNSLKELVHGGEISILHRVRLPKLEKLKLRLKWLTLLRPEDFVALSLSAHNLQYVEAEDLEMSLLSAIIDNFPVLKTLFVHFSSPSLDESSPPPYQQNQSLEELIIWKPLYAASVELVRGIINACPNQKRIQLYGAPLSDSQILEVIRSKSHLTHIWFSATYFDLFRRHDVVTGSLDPVLTDIIQIFRDSPKFVSLSFWGIADQRVENYLSQDMDRITVSKFSKTPFRTCLQLTKKSNIVGPFNKFDKQAESSFQQTDFLRARVSRC